MGNDLTKQSRTLVRDLQKKGWHVQTDRTHYMVGGLASGEIVVWPKTPSDYRGMRNVRAELKRLGYDRMSPHKEEKKMSRAKNMPVPSKLLRAQLSQLLIDLGEHRTAPGSKGYRGGARAKVAARMAAVTAEKGRPVASDTAYYKRIAYTLAGDHMNQRNIEVVEETVRQMRAELDQLAQIEAESDAMAEIEQEKVERLFKCESCHQRFESQHDLAEHMQRFHGPVKQVPRYGEVTIEPVVLTANGRGELHMEVLAAILDHRVTREEALQIARKVAQLEGVTHS